jgi:hypothetical protein
MAKNPPETKTQKMRMTILFQVEYDAPVDMYEDRNPTEMAKADTVAIMTQPYDTIQSFGRDPGAQFRAKVEPVFTEAQKAGLEVKK